MEGEEYNYSTSDCWVIKSLQKQNYWRLKLKNIKEVSWPNAKSTINLHQWSLLIDKLEAHGYILRHEFPGIKNGGIIQPSKSLKKLGKPVLSYTDNAHYLDLELLAYKIVQQLQK